jgi:hypothetical protein
MSIKQSKIQSDDRYRDAKTAASRSTQGRTSLIASTHDQNFTVMSSLGNESVSPSRHARLGSLLFSDFVFCKRASHVKTNRENIMLSHTQAKVFLECYNNITPQPKEKNMLLYSVWMLDETGTLRRGPPIKKTPEQAFDHFMKRICGGRVMAEEIPNEAVEDMIDLPKGVVLRHSAFKGDPWDEYWKLPWKVFFLVTVPS